MDGQEIGEKAQIKGNLYIVGGDEEPGSSEGYLPDMAEYMLDAFAQATEGLLGVKYEPLFCLGTREGV